MSNLYDTQIINGVEIIRGMPIEEYHASPILSHTKVQHWLTESPKWWEAKYVKGGRMEGSEAEHFVVGRALDHLLFERETFAQSFTISPGMYPAIEKVTKEKLGSTVLADADAIVEATRYHDEKKQAEFLKAPCSIVMKPWIGSATYCQGWEAERSAEGFTILTTDQMRLIKAQAIEISRNPFAREILSAKGAETQVTFRWEIDGIMVQTRPDIVNFLLWDWHDLKSTRELGAVGKHFVFMGYDMQAGLAYDALRRIRGAEPRQATHIYVDKSLYPTCEVRDIYGGEVGPAYVEYGLARFMKAAREIEHARKTGKFERPQRNRLPMLVPEWIQRKITEGESVEPDEFLPTDEAAEALKF